MANTKGTETMPRIRLLARRGEGSNLSVLTVYPFKDGPICAVFKAALGSGGLVLLVALTEPFGTKIKGIAEGLVDALERVTARHEDLKEGRWLVRCQMAVFG